MPLEADLILKIHESLGIRTPVEIYQKTMGNYEKEVPLIEFPLKLFDFPINDFSCNKTMRHIVYDLKDKDLLFYLGNILTKQIHLKQKDLYDFFSEPQFDNLIKLEKQELNIFLEYYRLFHTDFIFQNKMEYDYLLDQVSEINLKDGYYYAYNDIKESYLFVEVKDRSRIINQVEAPSLDSIVYAFNGGGDCYNHDVDRSTLNIYIKDQVTNWLTHYPEQVIKQLMSLELDIENEEQLEKTYQVFINSDSDTLLNPKYFELE
ncbi:MULTISPECIES: hypothetical protein [Aerococcus]|uniref:Uncharacterized protein n=1 Tax=Aerococcus tenax TaxID=3078812 RepID=A0A5N1BER7_9LACT|nr:MULTISPECIES: hypothetical protein [Aerococcus]KAA9237840.1 hypothetical protein F6I34_09260 [Aerococcus urinae]MDK6371640.1 hypothetical protein [Aerococcus urinae]MDK6597065.1 hypothetical protein [Aerococcus urinae]MDK7802023.1 hypothetical protein [Aerococcus urinae]MDK8655610.1 hypothetical protein [Aerococcus urinae]